MLAFLIVLGVVVLDQISKFFIRLNLEIGEKITLIPHVVGLTRSENTGASFGMLKDARWVFMVTSVVAIAALVGILIYHYRQPASERRNTLFVVSVAFILGGGIGNMIDRLFVTGSTGEKVVTDMIELLFVDFAIFNVADSFISVGAALLCVYVVFFETKYEKAHRRDKDTGTDEDKAEDAHE